MHIVASFPSFFSAYYACKLVAYNHDFSSGKVDQNEKHYLELLQWTFAVGNSFFHCLYHSGVFLTRDVACAAVKLGYFLVEP